jgi:hypothetical protein
MIVKRGHKKVLTDTSSGNEFLPSLEGYTLMVNKNDNVKNKLNNL